MVKIYRSRVYFAGMHKNELDSDYSPIIYVVKKFLQNGEGFQVIENESAIYLTQSIKAFIIAALSFVQTED